MKESGKKTFKKKNSKPIFGEVNEGDHIKKNIGQISGKVNEGDQIKKTLDLYLKKLMSAMEKQAKKHSWKNILISQNWLFFWKSATI